MGDDDFQREHSAEEALNEPKNSQQFGGSNDGVDLSVEDTIIDNTLHDESVERGEQHQDPMPDQVQAEATRPSMTPQETRWWAMSFEELYEHARSRNFGKTGKESRKSGRTRIIKWLCEKEGIRPYVAPNVGHVEANHTIAYPNVRSTGAISHPEAILRTTEPALQHMIDEAEKKYRQWPANHLMALAMQRSYLLLKDSHGKLPSKSISAMAKWLAAWDVLKSPREKRWWLGDGIDLANKAKAMGYQGSSKKYDIIVWLRSTPEEVEIEVTQVAEPTPNRRPVKRREEEATPRVSKRSAKGSRRPHGWLTQNNL